MKKKKKISPPSKGQLSKKNRQLHISGTGLGMLAGFFAAVYVAVKHPDLFEQIKTAMETEIGKPIAEMTADEMRQQMQKYIDREDYESAAQIKKLIDQKNKKS